MASLPDPGHDPLALGRTDRLRCPHCKFAGRRRSSREITPTHRDIYYQCTNLFCGHTWKASETYDYGIVPSAIPDPRVTLPLRAVSRQDAMEITRPATRPSPNCSTAPARPSCPADRPSFLTAATVSASPPPGLVSGDGKALPERTASMRLSAQSQPASFECSCGNEHRAADGLLPMGWTARHGACWCPDCTRSGAPARQLLHGGTRQRRRAA
jgi:hypothetical protein